MQLKKLQQLLHATSITLSHILCHEAVQAMTDRLYLFTSYKQKYAAFFLGRHGTLGGDLGRPRVDLGKTKMEGLNGQKASEMHC